VVGVNGYGPPGPPSLRLAVPDAAAVAEVLQRRWPDDWDREVFLLTRDATGRAPVVPDGVVWEDATQAALLAQMAAISGRAEKGDLVVFFFAGHALYGVEEARMQWYGLLPESKVDVPKTMLEWEDIGGYLKESPADKLVVMDACEAPLTPVGGGAPVPAEWVSLLDPALGNVALISSSRLREVVWEPQDRENSILTECLLDVLDDRDGRHDGDGWVTAAELCRRVCDEVPGRAREAHLAQTPVVACPKTDFDVCFVQEKARSALRTKLEDRFRALFADGEVTRAEFSCAQDLFDGDKHRSGMRADLWQAVLWNDAEALAETTRKSDGEAAAADRFRLHYSLRAACRRCWARWAMLVVALAAVCVAIVPIRSFWRHSPRMVQCFYDVPEKEPSYKEIQGVGIAGLMEGYPVKDKRLFRSQQVILRREAVLSLARLLPSAPGEVQSPRLSEKLALSRVAPDDGKVQTAVATAIDYAVIPPTPERLRFGTTDPLTRREMVCWLAEVIRRAAPAARPKDADVDRISKTEGVPQEVARAAALLQLHKIVPPDADGKFSLERRCYRRYFAVSLYRVALALSDEHIVWWEASYHPSADALSR
jgi:hypothetical protein